MMRIWARSAHSIQALDVLDVLVDDQLGLVRKAISSRATSARARNKRHGGSLLLTRNGIE